MIMEFKLKWHLFGGTKKSCLSNITQSNVKGSVVVAKCDNTLLKFKWKFLSIKASAW